LLSYLHQIAVLPALLIALGGLLVLRSAETERAQRRFMLYLLVVAGVLLLALFVAIQLTPEQDNRPFRQMMTITTPALIGVLALIILYGKQIITMGRATQLLALLLTAGLAGILVAHWNTRFALAYLILPGLFVLVLGWAIGGRSRKAAVVLGILLLLGLLGLNAIINANNWELAPQFRWMGVIFLAAFYSLPGLIVVGAAMLLSHSLASRGRRPALLSLFLMVLLLAYLAYSIYWASVWDQTSDGLGGLALSQPAAVVAAGAGMIVATKLYGWRRGTGLLFAILIPLLLLGSFERGWQVSYHDITQTRAERIAAALGDYFQREGTYPRALDSLRQRDLLRIPQPVELRGETWCYQGGDDFYRLGAFSREFFSMPVELQVFAAEGEPDSVWACEGQIAAMKERYYSPMEDPGAMRPPVPTPMPPSRIAQEAEAISPLLEGDDIVWGSWSPDSTYFLLGQRDSAGDVTFSLLDGQSGELCAVPGTYSLPPLTVNLREHHAWLPDGQLLLVDADGQVTILAPCTPEARTIMPEAMGSMVEIMAQDEEGGRILLKSANEFWILSGRTLTWQPVPGATPNPYDAHWDNAAWQPGGEELAITRLNGRDASDGSTLYIIDGDTGEIIRSVPLAEASDQSAPRVDWLSPQDLMLSGGGVLHILDLSADPPQSTDVLAEIFGLDLDFSDELWGHGWEVDWRGGHYILTVRANHPRNQSLYLYDSAEGRIDDIDEEANLLLFYPGGQMEQWANTGSEASQLDEFVVIDMAAEGSAGYPQLAIAGHTPRDYPMLNLVFVDELGLLAAASSQGISLHAFPGGETIKFWRLEGGGFSPYLRPAPDGSALVAVRDQGGAYWIPLP
jgi:hypothetical protein